MMKDDDLRDGEILLPFDPSEMAADARLMFIGRIRSPWTDRKTCPHNIAEARTRGGGATVEVDAPFRQGLRGVEKHTHVILLYWLDRARRDLIVQRPRQAEHTSGVFALRSPLRTNPIGLAVVKLLAIDERTGRLEIEAIDCLDGTPLIDIKPYIARVDFGGPS